MEIKRTMYLGWKRLLRWVGMMILVTSLGGFGVLQTSCTGDPCQQFFQELKRRCRLGSSAEGVKLDQFLNQQFSTCQLDLCGRTSFNTIDCANPDTHIPGGINGRFFTCQ